MTFNGKAARSFGSAREAMEFGKRLGGTSTGRKASIRIRTIKV